MMEWVVMMALAGLLLAVQLSPRLGNDGPSLQRSVKVHLNLLKCKWDDKTRALMYGEDPPLDIAGGFAWQNRILFPIMLWAVLAPCDLADYRNPSAGIVLVLLTFVMIAFALFGMWVMLERLAYHRSVLTGLLMSTLLILLIIAGSPASLLLPGGF